MGALPSKHDPKTITYRAIQKALAIADPLRVPSFHVDTRPKNAVWDIFGNDKYGCCTFAGIARIMKNNAARKGRVLNITGKHVTKAYLDSTGGVDSGQMPINALNYCRNIGFKLDDGSVVKVVGFARVHDMYECRSALQSFGSLYVAAGLPRRLDEDRDRRWELTPREKRTNDDVPRTLGGHAYSVFGFQRNEEFAVPWDQEVIEEAAWSDYYREEAWVFIDSQETDPVLLTVMNAQLDALKGIA